MPELKCSHARRIHVIHESGIETRSEIVWWWSGEERLASPSTSYGILGAGRGGCVGVGVVGELCFRG